MTDADKIELAITETQRHMKSATGDIENQQFIQKYGRDRVDLASRHGEEATYEFAGSFLNFVSDKKISELTQKLDLSPSQQTVLESVLDTFKHLEASSLEGITAKKAAGVLAKNTPVLTDDILSLGFVSSSADPDPLKQLGEGFDIVRNAFFLKDLGYLAPKIKYVIDKEGKIHDVEPINQQLQASSVGVLPSQGVSVQESPNTEEDIPVVDAFFMTNWNMVKDQPDSFAFFGSIGAFDHPGSIGFYLFDDTTPFESKIPHIPKDLQKDALKITKVGDDYTIDYHGVFHYEGTSEPFTAQVRYIFAGETNIKGKHYRVYANNNEKDVIEYQKQ